MELHAWLKGKSGRSQKLAKGIGVPASFISKLRSGKKKVPIARCVAIERFTGGEVTRKDLRPDDWQNYWPELATPEPSSQMTAEGAVYCTQPELPLEIPESPVPPLNTAPNATENVAKKIG